MLQCDRRTALGAIATGVASGMPWAAGAETTFAAWLAELKAEARTRKVDRAVLEAAFAGVQPLQSVIDADRRQPEGRMTFVEYRTKVVNPTRIDRGRELLVAQAPLLRQIEARYGVPGQVLIALWGIESNFGERQGTYSVFAALATLAYEGRRAKFFRKELLSALQIADRGYAPTDEMLGSWAGAMGQNQFMPSTYLGYAVDFDGDGRRDIWRSLPDVFASMANYLSRSGWDSRYRWGREVLAPQEVGRGREGLDHRAPLPTWDRRGVRLLDGGPLPAIELPASLLQMDGGDGPSYLVYGNFRALMAWNRSTYFGVSVGLLSDSLRDG